MYTPFRVLIM